MNLSEFEKVAGDNPVGSVATAEGDRPPTSGPF